MSIYTAPATSATIVDGSIVDADVNASAAIAGTKISPNFGSQNVVTTGTSTAASLIPTGSSVPTNGMYLPSANNLSFSTSSTQRMLVDSSGRLLVGTSTSKSIGGTSAGLQVYSPTPLSHSISCERPDGRAIIHLCNSAAASNNTDLGSLVFAGNDGTSLNSTAASILCYVDGTPGANDMPGRLVFATTADGASSPTEAMRISSAGTVIYNQPAPAAVDTSATLTVANLTAKIITSTTAAAVTMTLPTGTNMDAGFSGLYNNMAFEWTVINTGGTNAVTVQGNTAHTVVGSGTVAANGSGRFLSRRTAGTTWVTYRLAT